MLDLSFLSTPVFSWVVLPFLIFVARICDVTVGTIRLMALSRGINFIVPILAFFEILIWLLAIGQIFNRPMNVFCYFAYAGGFAMGNYVGIIMEEKFAMGFEIFRIITKDSGQPLVDTLRAQGYGVTNVKAQGGTGDVYMIYTIINRREHNKIIEIIKRFNPKAFYCIEDVRSVSNAEHLSEKPSSFLSS